MRAILPFFAAACLLAFVVNRGRAEFDAGPAKPTQAARTFGDGMAATKRPARELTPEELLVALLKAPATQIAVEIDLVRRVRTPRTHRPANVPTRPYTEIGISYTEIEYRLAIPAK